ncbi:MAG TPA: alpha/beta hydrolase [Aliidongia sp.]|uniref:alpha/beta fold hydrolase n=1 Tax=Aliidongia sp. TaxID=1914230 RepID=UPI002DDDB73A|nr:alpha/beta hydrolase [Aliidongia sp.]HEV2672928.1 alpha/beta hydrolase [Aliidongia sp.]
MSRFTLDGQAVQIATGGQSFDRSLPTLVLIHGAGMDHTVWVNQARALAHRGRGVLAIDLPGHAGSAGPALGTIEAMAGWVWRLLDSLGVERAALAGHSMGSLVALEAGALGGDRTRGLALLGTVPRMAVHPAMLESAEAGDHRVIDMMVGWSFGRQSLLGAVGTPGSHLPGGAERLLERGPRQVIGSDLAACAAYEGALAAAARIACPARVILGAEDKMTPAAKAAPLASAIAGCRTLILPGAGHMMMLESPAPVTAALMEIA